MNERRIIAGFARRVALCSWLGLTACAEQGETAQPIELPDAGEDQVMGEAGPRDAEAGGCGERACYCEQICARGTALNCALDDGLESCLADCMEQPAQCAEPSLELLACQYALPEAAYSCDPIIESAVAAGCDEAKASLESCARR